jgi:Cell division GTPase
MAGKNPGEILTESLNESLPKIRARKGEFQMRMSTSVIGVGAGGGNIAHLMSDYDGYMTAAFNTTEADMIDLNVKHKIVIDGVNGSGKDRAFSAMEFKRSYKTFFEHPGIKELMKNDLIIIVGTGGGGTGTIISTMVAAYLKSEYPDKTIILIGILGSIKEDLVSQRNMLEFMSDAENKLEIPYLLFDNNRAKNRVGDEVYEKVNQDIVDAIRVISKEFFIENSRSNIDGRDYARLTHFKGLMSVVTIPKLNISVSEENVDLVGRIQAAIENSTIITTESPDAYGFFVNADPEVYNLIDTTFESVQTSIAGIPTSGLVFRHLQNNSGEGPEFAMIMTGMAAPISRFKMIERRIAEYENVKEKERLPEVERSSSSPLKLAGDSKSDKGTGKGFSALEQF